MMEMSPRLMRAYHRQIERIQAHEDLRAIRVAMAPHMKPEARRQTIRTLQRELRIPPKRVSWDELGDVIKGLRS